MNMHEEISGANQNSFIRASKEFCCFIETYQGPNKEFLSLAQKYLLKVYDLANDLQPVLLDSDYEDGPNEKSKVDYEKVKDFVNDSLLNNRYYWHVFNPVDDTDTQAVCGDLVDDLVDIYQDLKIGLLMFENELVTMKKVAMWQFKFGFDNHWGEHCINGIYAIHFFLRNN